MAQGNRCAWGTLGNVSKGGERSGEGGGVGKEMEVRRSGEKKREELARRGK